jgi:HSP20 family protein
MMPFGPWSYADVDEMMREMEREFMNFDLDQLPKHLVRESLTEDGSVRKEIGHIVYGYSVTIGPDGKADFREFGNMRPAPDKERGWRTITNVPDSREPLTDIVEDEREVRMIAELPGVKRKDDIELTSDGKTLVLRAKTPNKSYFKELPLPASAEVGGSRSTFNNGILEVVFPKRRGRGSGVRIRID